MLANRREKIIALVLLAVVGLLVADQYLLTPYLQERERLSKALDETTLKAEKAQKLLDARVRTNREWRGLLESGLTTDAATAEAQALNKVRQWAEESRVDLQSLKPDRVARSGDFQQVRIAAAGSGSTAAVASLLNRIETAKIPIKVNEVRLASRKEGNDDLTFSMSVSTIAFSPAPAKKPRVAVKGDAQ